MSSSISGRPDYAALSAELIELLGVVDPGAIADMLLQRAHSYGATDIHLDSVSNGLRIRFRIDGLLRDICPVPTEKATNIISRIKVLSNMDITERRLPQDGRISSTHLDGVDRDIRVGTMSTIYGERIVMRLMPDPTELTTLDSLGMYEDQLEQINRLLKTPYGLVLVVGPVGAGKSTTLYNFVSSLNSSDRSIVTIEDPVERRLPGASQIQVDNKFGLTFPVALRGVLRQDPNIMCIGEIRDAETAKIAARAATTGVLVMSTLHANDTASAVDVLRQLGIPSMVIADSLRAVISQRLIHRICETSRQEILPDEEARKLLHLPEDDSTTKITEGIPAPCNFETGYNGRTAIFETMMVGRHLKEAIHKDAASYEIADAALEDGMISLEESARRRVLDHTTSLAELHRTMIDKSLL
ncbi:MAG: GspE/PulE family protein [Fuerstiella sp.]|nr:GspE/PulE family protein [Fuerstiella sp.]